MPQTDNEKARDKAILHALLMLQFGRSLSARIVTILNGGDAALLDRLAAGLARIEERGLVLSPAAQGAVTGLLSDVAAANATTYASVGTALTDELRAFAGAEASFQSSAIKLIAGLNSAAMPTAADLDAIVSSAAVVDGATVDSWVDGMAAGRLTRIAQAVKQGLSRGLSTDQIIKTIKGTKAAGFADGVLNKSRQSAQAVARTATTGVSNATSQATWQANPAIISWQFQATLDERTTLECASLDGSIWPINSGPIPPIHINCRSIAAPVYEGKPAAKGLKLLDWLNGKSENEQNATLGKELGDKLRGGTLTLSDVLARTKIVTLDQLKAAHGDILS